MSTEETQPTEPATKSEKTLPIFFGIIAICLVLTGAGALFFVPLWGTIFLFAGVLVSIITFILSLICPSLWARRSCYIAIALALLSTLAGTITLFSNKGFEDRCVDAWKELTSLSDTVENRVDQLENRFDND